MPLKYGRHRSKMKVSARVVAAVAAGFCVIADLLLDVLVETLAAQTVGLPPCSADTMGTRKHCYYLFQALSFAVQLQPCAKISVGVSRKQTASSRLPLVRIARGSKEQGSVVQLRCKKNQPKQT